MSVTLTPCPRCHMTADQAKALLSYEAYRVWYYDHLIRPGLV